MVSHDVPLVPLVLLEFGPSQGKLGLIVFVELDANDCKLVPVVWTVAVFEHLIRFVRLSFAFTNLNHKRPTYLGSIERASISHLRFELGRAASRTRMWRL
jgi:hypothetical protein